MANLPATRPVTASIDRWDPMMRFEDMHRQMNHLMNSVFPQLDVMNGAWTPAADLAETDDEYHLEIDVPGVKRSDISIDLDGQDLMVSGEFSERRHEGHLRHSTRRTGRFEYSVRLPHMVEADKVDAELKNGVLRISVPKAEQARQRKIQIKG